MSASVSARLTRQSGTNFYYAFRILPEEKRRAIYALYAFCRTLDDCVDEPDGEREPGLVRWLAEVQRAYAGRPETELGRELAEAVTRFPIPRGAFEDIVAGCRMDLTTRRYASFAELRVYCERVASAVGLASIEIFGYLDPRSREYAVELGLALQLTNILRDIKDDAGRGRIYLPQEDLRRFGYSEDDLLNCRYTPEFVNLMRFQVERARTYFRLAQEALTNDDKGFFFPARIMWSIYAHLLNRIERSQYNVFERRITISRMLRILIAVRYWLSHQIRYRGQVRVGSVQPGE